MTKKYRAASNLGPSRIYWRNQGSELRAYADLRHLGAGRVALIPPGEKKATTDPAMAEELLRLRVNELVRRRRDRVLLGIEPDADLTAYAIYHLRVMQDHDEYSPAWLAITEGYLARAVARSTPPPSCFSTGRRRPAGLFSVSPSERSPSAPGAVALHDRLNPALGEVHQRRGLRPRPPLRRRPQHLKWPHLRRIPARAGALE